MFWSRQSSFHNRSAAVRLAVVLGVVALGMVGVVRFRHLLRVEAQQLQQRDAPSASTRADEKQKVTSAKGKPVTIAAHPGTGLRKGESAEEAARASVGCVSCHVGIEHPNMHTEDTVALGCADCHGGRAEVMSEGEKGSAVYGKAEKAAHVLPRLAEDGDRAGHPKRVYTRWLKESYEYVRFVNPGDLRVAPETCGTCHAAETRNVKTSMMTHGAMLWGAAMYNNGSFR